MAERGGTRRPGRAQASASPAAVAAGSGSVRIIGGSLRGSRLPVLNRPGLRPSSDRVRETLFNWLQRELPGATVADLFAGTGCLALESLSRGAKRAFAVERDPGLVDHLRSQANRLGVADRLELRRADATASAPAAGERVDIVFLDPPFQADLWAAAVAAAQRWLAPRGWVYLEAPQGLKPALGPNWQLHREGSTRDVRFALYRVEPSEPAVAD